MGITRRSATLGVATALIGFAKPSFSDMSSMKEQKDIIWDVSLFGGPRQLTFPIEDWANAMVAATNGHWKINLHYGGVLGKPEDQLKGLKTRLFDAGLWIPQYNPNLTPLHGVEDLPFLSPATIIEIGEYLWALGRESEMVDELAKWNTKILFPTPVPHYQFIGKKPINSVVDFKGARIRAPAPLGRILHKFGAVPLMMPAPEIYTAMQRGMLDLVAAPWPFMAGAYNLHELSKFATVSFDGGSNGMQMGVNIDAWDELPKEWQRVHEKWVRENIIKLYDEYNNKAIDKWIPEFRESGVQFNDMPTSVKKELLEVAEDEWQAWANKLEDNGFPGKKILTKAKEIAKR